MNKSKAQQIKKNIKIHNKIITFYNKNHDEIFNELEQQRIRKEFETIKNELGSGVEALDFGCGTGNLTQHLISLGFNVTAADVSELSVRLVGQKYNVKTQILDGGDVLGFEDNSFDLIAVYSVLHHLPDYLAIVKEFTRILKPGGILYIDHEYSPEYWENYYEVKKKLKKISKINWKKFLTFSNYYHKLLSFFIDKYSNEGDIHVWPDKHVEWAKIDDLLLGSQFRVWKTKDYLLYRNIYKFEEYKDLSNQIADVRSCMYIKS